MKDLSIHLFMVLPHRKYLLYFAAMYYYKLICTQNAIGRFGTCFLFFHEVPGLWGCLIKLNETVIFV